MPSGCRGCVSGAYKRCASMIAMSSSSDQRSFLMLGFRWLCQRSRHCLPMRPGSFCAMSDQFFGPWCPTICFTSSSSSCVQGPFTRLGFSTFCQRCRHCTSVRSRKKPAIFFQLRASLQLNYPVLVHQVLQLRVFLRLPPLLYLVLLRVRLALRQARHLSPEVLQYFARPQLG